MTIYDPADPDYRDEKAVRDELTRVFDVCQGCRACTNFCSSFPTLFETIDLLADGDAGRMTPHQQDRVVDSCSQCKHCVVICPYTPERHELRLDFPRLMLRAQAMQHRAGQRTVRQRVTAAVRGRSDVVGRWGARATRWAGGAFGTRRMGSRFAPQRFSAWFGRRDRSGSPDGEDRAVVFPTCLVEYRESVVGRDLVLLYERHHVECSISAAGCCGAPSLHAGDIERFARIAARNVRVLADEIRRSGAIVVPVPSCGFVLRSDYLDHVGGPDAELVAAHTLDASEFLVALQAERSPDRAAPSARESVASAAYCVPWQLPAVGAGWPSLDLMQAAGVDVGVVEQPDVDVGPWGPVPDSAAIDFRIGERFAATISERDADHVVSDNPCVGPRIDRLTGAASEHPLSLLARVAGASEPS